MRAPETIDATGLPLLFILRLTLKLMYVRGLQTSSQLASEICLARGIVDRALEEARSLQLVAPLGAAGGSFSAEIRFELTSKGIDWVMEAMAQSQYVGPCPVTLEDYAAQVAAQSITREPLPAARLEAAFAGIVLPEALVARLGAAANSGKAILLYGPPGNGKSCVAEAIGAAFGESIAVPHAVAVDGQVIKVFDGAIHRPLDSEAGESAAAALGLRRQAMHDRRWVMCRRPVVVTGGELVLEMLDLTYSNTTGFYEAPVQMKAAGGVVVIDDFGRQRIPPQAILNRWIIPLERRVDYLTLHTGKKFQAPFDALVIFSTNIPPLEVADEAGLRRIHYKIEMQAPSKAEYAVIFRQCCAEAGLCFDEGVLRHLEETYYDSGRLVRAGFHPVFLTQQVVAICRYQGREPVLTSETLAQAMSNLIVG